MRSATQILFDHLGRPKTNAVSQVMDACWLCGGNSDRGVPYVDWMGSNFVGQNRVRNPRGTFVCEACFYFCQRGAPVPGRPPKEGKQFGGNYRNYSHCFDSGSYFNASKGEKYLIRDFLASPHGTMWFAAIADSGQKHVLPWAPVNVRSQRGRVLFEEMEVTIPERDSQEFGLIEIISDLLTEGATKESVRQGIYQAGEWFLCEVAIRKFELVWSYKRDSPWWQLALWLAQRDEEKVAQRIAKEVENATARRRGSRKTSNNDSGCVTRSKKSILTK